MKRIASILSVAIAYTCQFAAAAPPLQASGAFDTTVTSPDDAIAHPSDGCAGAVVLTPRQGTQFAHTASPHSASARSFYEIAADTNVEWLSEMVCGIDDMPHAMTKSSQEGIESTPGLFTTYYTYNWSGYELDHTALYMQGLYTEPSVSAPYPGYAPAGYGYASSIWAGMGGGEAALTSILMQSGTTQLTMANTSVCPGSSVTHFFWYEIYRGPAGMSGARPICNMPLYPGDQVGAFTAWVATTGQTQFGLCNYTRSQCLNFTVSGSTTPPGATAEWIVEAPTVTGIIQPLARFGNVSFHDLCWASTYTPGGAITCGAFTSPQTLILHSNVLGGVQILAEPGVMSSNGNFVDYYRQPVDETCGHPGHPACP
jgi:hypothetical protein